MGTAYFNVFFTIVVLMIISQRGKFMEAIT